MSLNIPEITVYFCLSQKHSIVLHSVHANKLHFYVNMLCDTVEAYNKIIDYPYAKGKLYEQSLLFELILQLLFLKILIQLLHQYYTNKIESISAIVN